jgi:hypothetical protein
MSHVAVDGRPTEMVDSQQEWWMANRFDGRPPELVDSQVISISINRALVPVGKFSLFLLQKALLYTW